MKKERLDREANKKRREEALALKAEQAKEEQEMQEMDRRLLS